MKLYMSPGACSLSPHIVMREAGIAFEVEPVNLGTKVTKSGADYRAVNPKGSVPALEMDDGQILTEGPAIVQYLADCKPEAKLAPPAGTLERYRLQEWLNYIASELHKGFSPLFNPKVTEEWRQIIKDNLAQRFDFLAKKLDGRKYLMGDSFTIADAYLFTIMSWAKPMKIDLSKWPSLQSYMQRIAERPAVQSALKAEGLS